MHAVQGAMAVRRERQKRMNRRLSERRKRQNAGDDSCSSRRPSQYSQSGDVESATGAPGKTKGKTSMTAFYLGVVFILLGFLLIFSSMIPANIVNADWSRLLGVGVTFLMVGLMMVMVNRIVSAQEEEELHKYVSSRLARTRSGQVLCRNRDPSLDLTKLVPPGAAPSSRRPSYRDRPGSTRSITRTPGVKSTQNTPPGGIEHGSSVRRSVRKPSPQSSTHGTMVNLGPAPSTTNISRNNSQRGSRCNLDRNPSLTSSQPKKNISSSSEDFRGRTASFKGGSNLTPATLLVRVTDTSNSTSLILLNPDSCANGVPAG